MKLIWLAPLIAIGLAGCVGTTAPTFTNNNAGQATGGPADFTTDVAAGDTVETDQLPPLDGAEQPAENVAFGPQPVPAPQAESPLAPANEVGQPDQAAALAARSGVTITAVDLPGGWTISVDGGACPLSLTETPWEDGFRASTRGCQSDALASLSSWRLDGQTVVLSSGGTVVARLAATSIFRDGDIVTNARFEGQLVTGGIPVSFFR